MAALKTLLFKPSEAYQFDWSKEGLVRLKLPSGQGAGKKGKMTRPANPFRCFNSSPEAIRMAVMLYVWYSLSLRKG